MVVKSGAVKASDIIIPSAD